MAKTKVELQNYQGESLSPITIASNVLYEDGRNAQEVFEEYSNETFTPTIENSSSMFKVGQGDSVDYSDNIVNGAYESMVLKGKSMVNCIQEPSSQDVVLPYEFEDGQYVTINDTKESGALGVKLKGQTLVNLCKNSGKDLIYTNINSSTSLCYKIKDNTWYYLIINVKQNTLNKPFRFSGWTLAHGATPMSGTEISVSDKDVFDVGETGVKRFKIGYSNIPEDKGKSLIMFTADSSTTTGQVTYDIMLLEYQEGMENWDIPYFEGMTSCKVPVLHSVNQMFDYSCATKPTNTGTISFANDGRTLKTDFDVVRDCVNVTNITLPAGTYDISYKIRGSVTLPEGASLSSSRAGLALSRSSEIWSNCRETLMIKYSVMDSVNYTKVTKTFTFDEPVTVSVVYHGWNNSPVGWCELTDIRIVPQGKSSILSLPEEVVLRSLPNGVCDTFNTKTGVYTQRIGELILDGSLDEYWTDYKKELDTTQAFYASYNIIGKCYDIISNSFPTISKGKIQASDIEGISTDEGNERGFVFIRIKKSRLSTQDINGFKAWLQSNPVTVQYQLETPVITKINLPSTLKSWNTTTHIYSEIPENTLYPTLTHSNPTYPVILKPSTKYSIVANSYSNDHTNSAINFNLGGATASTTVGNRVTTITTPSTLSNELLTMSGRGNKLNNVMVIEGDVVGDEPYFEGICDCKSPILSNVGKNLFDKNNVMKDKYISGAGKETSEVGTNRNATNFIQVKPNTSYLLSGIQNSGVTNSNKQFYVAQYDANKEKIVVTAPSVSSDYVKITTEAKTKYIRTTIKDDDLDRCQIEQSTQATPHEPYKSNILSCETYFDETTQSDKTIVLRSLPNGVCDTLNVETGEYVQRIGEIVFDGSENWLMETNENWASCRFKLNKTFSSGNYTTDNIITNGKYVGGYTSNEANTVRISNNAIYIFDKTLTSLSDFKNFLQQNPLTTQYELATPIVSTVDIQGFPYAYKNGHVQLSSGSIEQSLTPKVEYSVVTNRNGQIRSNQKMVERHQKQLDQLQAIILANMVNTQYQQTLTTLNYDLLKKEVGE